MLDCAGPLQPAIRAVSVSNTLFLDQAGFRIQAYLARLARQCPACLALL